MPTYQKAIQEAHATIHQACHPPSGHRASNCLDRSIISSTSGAGMTSTCVVSRDRIVDISMLGWGSSGEDSFVVVIDMSYSRVNEEIK